MVQTAVLQCCSEDGERSAVQSFQSSAAALKIVMVSIVEGREEVLLQAGDLSTISTTAWNEG